MSSDESITIGIDVEGADEAADQINNVTSALKGVNDVHVDNLNNAADSLDAVANSAQGVVDPLNQAKGSLDDIQLIDLSNLDTASQTFDSLSSSAGAAADPVDKVKGSLDDLSTVDTSSLDNTGRSLDALGNAAQQTVDPLGLSRDRMNELGGVSDSAATGVKTFTGSLSSAASSISAVALGALTLVEGYTQMERAQTNADRAQTRLNQSRQVEQGLQDRLNALIAAGDTSSAKYSQTQQQLAVAQQRVADNTDFAGLAQQRANEAFAYFFVTLVPSGVGVVSGLVQTISTLPSTIDTIKNSFSAVGDAISGLGGKFQSLKGIISDLGALGGGTLLPVVAIVAGFTAIAVAANKISENATALHDFFKQIGDDAETYVGTAAKQHITDFGDAFISSGEFIKGSLNEVGSMLGITQSDVDKFTSMSLDDMHKLADQFVETGHTGNFAADQIMAAWQKQAEAQGKNVADYIKGKEDQMHIDEIQAEIAKEAMQKQIEDMKHYQDAAKMTGESLEKDFTAKITALKAELTGVVPGLEQFGSWGTTIRTAFVELGNEMDKFGASSNRNAEAFKTFGTDTQASLEKLKPVFQDLGIDQTALNRAIEDAAKAKNGDKAAAADLLVQYDALNTQIQNFSGHTDESINKMQVHRDLMVSLAAQTLGYQKAVTMTTADLEDYNKTTTKVHQTMSDMTNEMEDTTRVQNAQAQAIVALGGSWQGVQKTLSDLNLEYAKAVAKQDELNTQLTDSEAIWLRQQKAIQDGHSAFDTFLKDLDDTHLKNATLLSDLSLQATAFGATRGYMTATVDNVEAYIKAVKEGGQATLDFESMVKESWSKITSAASGFFSSLVSAFQKGGKEGADDLKKAFDDLPLGVKSQLTKVDQVALDWGASFGAQMTNLGQTFAIKMQSGLDQGMSPEQATAYASRWVGGLASGIQRQYPQFSSQMQVFWQALSSGQPEQIAQALKLMEGMPAPISGIAKQISDSFSQTWEGLTTGSKTSTQAAADNMQYMWQAAYGVFLNFQSSQAIINTWADSIKKAFAPPDISAILRAFGELSTVAQTTFTNMQTQATTAATTIGTNLARMPGLAAPAFGQLASTAQTTFNNIATQAQTAVTTIGTNFGGLPGKVAPAFGTLSSTAQTTFQNIVSNAFRDVDQIAGAFNALPGKVAPAFGTLASIAQTTFNNMVVQARAAAQQIAAAFQGISATGGGQAGAGGALSGVIGAQAGFTGVVTKPTLFLAGEAGPESVSVVPHAAGTTTAAAGVGGATTLIAAIKDLINATNLASKALAGSGLQEAADSAAGSTQALSNNTASAAERMGVYNTTLTAGGTNMQNMSTQTKGAATSVTQLGASSTQASGSMGQLGASTGAASAGMNQLGSSSAQAGQSMNGMAANTASADERMGVYKTTMADANEKLGIYKTTMSSADEKLGHYKNTMDQGDSSLSKMNSSTDKAGQSLNSTGSSADKASQGLNQTGTSANTASTDLGKTSQSAQQTSQGLGTANEKLGQYNTTLGTVTQGMGPVGQAGQQASSGLGQAGQGATQFAQAATSAAQQIQSVARLSVSGAQGVAGAPGFGAPRAFQHGFVGIIDKPTLFLAGEAGPEFVSVVPGGVGGAGAGGGVGTDMVTSLTDMVSSMNKLNTSLQNNSTVMATVNTSFSNLLSSLLYNNTATGANTTMTNTNTGSTGINTDATNSNTDGVNTSTAAFGNLFGQTTSTTDGLHFVTLASNDATSAIHDTAAITRDLGSAMNQLTSAITGGGGAGGGFGGGGAGGGGAPYYGPAAFAPYAQYGNFSYGTPTSGQPGAPGVYPGAGGGGGRTGAGPGPFGAYAGYGNFSQGTPTSGQPGAPGVYPGGGGGGQQIQGAPYGVGPFGALASYGNFSQGGAGGPQGGQGGSFGPPGQSSGNASGGGYQQPGPQPGPWQALGAATGAHLTVGGMGQYGFEGIIRSATAIVAGEGGPEYVSIRPASRIGSSVRGAVQTDVAAIMDLIAQLIAQIQSQTTNINLNAYLDSYNVYRSQQKYTNSRIGGFLQ